MATKPKGLRRGGSALWKSITDEHELDGQQIVQLTEACRAKDRLDRLDEILNGSLDAWTEIQFDTGGEPVSLRIDAVLQRANETANLMKQLLAALRLPDATGARPQRRGPRGAQAPSVPGGANISSLERARARRRGA